MRGAPDEARGAVEYLRSPAAIRARCGAIYRAGLRSELPHFEVRMERMDAVVSRVARSAIATSTP